jgi:hypothetical protein
MFPAGTLFIQKKNGSVQDKGPKEKKSGYWGYLFWPMPKRH